MGSSQSREPPKKQRVLVVGAGAAGGIRTVGCARSVSRAHAASWHSAHRSRSVSIVQQLLPASRALPVPIPREPNRIHCQLHFQHPCIP